MSQRKNSISYVNKICEVCNIGYFGHPNTKVCSNEECKKQYKRDYENNNRHKKSLLKYPDGSDPYFFVECAICGFRSPDISSHVVKLHGISNEDYKKQYGNTKSQQLIDSVTGDKNPAYNHGGRLSPFSKKFVKYENVENVENAEEIISNLVAKSTQTARDNDNIFNTVEYHLKRGKTLEEAEEIIRTACVFTLDKCISKHGEEEGYKIWKDRQDRWQATLNAKSDEEKREINRKKLYKSGIVSSIEKLLRELLEKETNLNLHFQLTLQRTDEPTKHFIYDIIHENKIIEFNGDFWHANPNKYKADDLVNIPRNPTLAKEIWEYDQLKHNLAKQNGYEIFVVWESDFKKNKQFVIEQCKNFLTQ